MKKILVTSSITLSTALMLLMNPAYSQQETATEPGVVEETKNDEKAGVDNPLTQCGIGALFFPNSGTAATFSNVIWDFGTTAVSSQTSSPSSCNGAHASAAVFIHGTYAVLEEQFVKGGGDHVAALMNILGCDASVQSGVINRVQGDLSVSLQNADFTSATQLEKTQQLKTSVGNATSVCNA